MLPDLYAMNFHYFTHHMGWQIYTTITLTEPLSTHPLAHSYFGIHSMLTELYAVNCHHFVHNMVRLTHTTTKTKGWSCHSMHRWGGCVDISWRREFNYLESFWRGITTKFHKKESFHISCRQCPWNLASLSQALLILIESQVSNGGRISMGD